MAQAIITKQSIEKLTEDDYQVTIHVIIENDAAQTVIEKDYSERYYSSLSIDIIKQKLQDKIKTDWDKYTAEQIIFDAAAFDTMVSEIQTTANTYINL